MLINLRVFYMYTLLNMKNYMNTFAKFLFACRPSWNTYFAWIPFFFFFFWHMYPCHLMPLRNKQFKIKMTAKRIKYKNIRANSNFARAFMQFYIFRRLYNQKTLNLKWRKWDMARWLWLNLTSIKCANSIP